MKQAQIQISKKINVVPYDLNWPSQYKTASQEIINLLNSNLIEIHHIGSTSVPGLASKPKIDIVAAD